MASIDSYFNGKKQSTKDLVLKDFINKSSKIIKRLNLKEIDIVLNQLANLSISIFNHQDKLIDLKSKLDELSNLYRTIGILENSTTKQDNNLSVYIVNDNTFLCLLNEILKDISYGKRICFIVNSINKSNKLLNLMKKIEKLLQDGLLNLLIKENQNRFDNVVELDDKRIKNPIPVYILFRECDYISAIESIPDLLTSKSNYKNCIVLVQENQIKVVKELFDQLFPTLVNKTELTLNQKELIKSYKYEIVNYDLNTILDNNLDENVNLNKINLLEFRDKYDAVKLVNHCENIPFVSVWCKNLSTNLFVAENLTTTNLIWFNSILKYHISIPNFNYLNLENLNLNLDTVNLSREELKNFKLLEDYLNRKVSRLEANELIDLLLPCLRDSEFENQFEVFQHLNTFYQKMIKFIVTKDGKYIVKHYPIGFIHLSIDHDNNLIELFNLIVSCILSNNLLYLTIKKDLDQEKLIRHFISLFSTITNTDYFKKMIILDDGNVFTDEKLRTIIKHENKHIGTVIKYSELRSNTDFHSLETKLFKTKIIFNPKYVLDNTN